jgi:hypothetical protein
LYRWVSASRASSDRRSPVVRIHQMLARPEDEARLNECQGGGSTFQMRPSAKRRDRIALGEL